MNGVGVAYLHQGVGLGETLQALHQLGQFRGVLRFHSDTDDSRNRELHGNQRIRFGVGGESSALGEVLVNADHGDGVSGRDRLDGLSVLAHHDDGSLHTLFKEIL